MLAVLERALPSLVLVLQSTGRSGNHDSFDGFGGVGGFGSFGHDGTALTLNPAFPTF